MHVYKIVYALLEEGKLSHQQIANEVRREIPGAQTTAKSVASHAVAWRRQQKTGKLKQDSSEADFSKAASLPRNPDFKLAPQEAVPPRRPTLSEIGEVIREARDLATRYYQLTGRPLGVTGEIGEYEAVEKLGLALAPARAPGYDAVDGIGRKLQVKTRSFGNNAKRSQTLGAINLKHEWDAVILVLLDDVLHCREIWEADREPVEVALSSPGSRARNERGALAVSKFKSIGRRVWAVF